MKISAVPFSCPVCECQSYVHFMDCTDHFVSGREFPIGQCTSCGLKFTVNPPSESEIGDYYHSGDYISHSDTSKGLVNRIYHLVRELMLTRKKNIVETSAGIKNGNILDIGAGTGYFLSCMKKAGWQVEGVEKSMDAISFAHSTFNIDLKPDTDLYKLPHSFYDTVTMWHVLEHVYDLPKMIGQIRSLLKGTGVLLVALPNPSSYDAIHYGRWWAAWDVPRHLWHFSPTDVGKLFQKSGFSVRKKYRLMFDSFYISILSEKYKKSGFPFFKGILIGKISLISSLFKKHRCSSLVYVLEKN